MPSVEEKLYQDFFLKKRSDFNQEKNNWNKHLFDGYDKKRGKNPLVNLHIKVRWKNCWQRQKTTKTTTTTTNCQNLVWSDW